MASTQVLTSPNQIEISFLQSKDKSCEYLTHIHDIDFGDSPLIIDVGANVGAFSVSMATHFKDVNARIYAFEPFKELFSHLVQNTTSLPVTTVNKAIMETESFVIGSYLPNYTLLSGFFVAQSDKAALENLSDKNLDNEFKIINESVESVRLDSFMESHNIAKVDILKIDVEKAELEVLKSLGDKLSCVKCVVAEVHEPNLDSFVKLLAFHFNDINVGQKDLPKFLLDNKEVTEWPEHINTYIVFAQKR